MSLPEVPESQMTITYRNELVSPGTAMTWLEGNTHNRPIRQGDVDKWATDMREGRWVLNGDTVKFDTEGTLVDGQHRLWAVIQADTCVAMTVARNVPLEAQDTIDIGSRRTAGDQLILGGADLSRAAAQSTSAIVRGLFLYEGKRASQTEVLAFARAHADRLGQAVYYVNASKTAGLRGGTIYGLAFYVLSEVDFEDATTFMRDVTTGEGLVQGDPQYALRSRFLRTPPRTDRSPSSVKVNMAYVVKAWNAWREGRKLQHIRYALDEPAPVAR